MIRAVLINQYGSGQFGEMGNTILIELGFADSKFFRRMRDIFSFKTCSELLLFQNFICIYHNIMTIAQVRDKLISLFGFGGACCLQLLL